MTAEQKKVGLMRGEFPKGNRGRIKWCCVLFQIIVSMQQRLVEEVAYGLMGRLRDRESNNYGGGEGEGKCTTKRKRRIWG